MKNHTAIIIYVIDGKIPTVTVEKKTNPCYFINRTMGLPEYDKKD